jgi:uncharacterized protein (DUF1501 family)
MNRRNFTKNILAFCVYNGVSLKTYSNTLSNLLSLYQPLTNNILVIIQLSGGNDGLNMLPPLDQMSKYNQLRPNIKLNENAIITLGTSGVGLHPAMSSIKSLYDENLVKIIQGLSYPNQSFSHFAATKIWNTGFINNSGDTGWLGRYLRTVYTDYPNSSYEDPIALQVEDLSSTLFSSDAGIMSASYSNNTINSIIASSTTTANGTYNGATTNPNNNTDYSEYLGFISNQILLSDQFANQIKVAGKKGTNFYNYPNTTLANKLKTIAKLIHGGLNTRIYHVSIGGFDTHNDQLNRQNALLTELSEAIHAFQRDLIAMGSDISKRVIGLTFSEFGRRAQENASGGTDHGTAVPIFIFGTTLSDIKIIGTSPNLNNLTDNNLPTQFDYRQVYSTILTDWFGLTNMETNQLFQSNATSNNMAFTPLPIFNACEISKECIPLKIYK